MNQPDINLKTESDNESCSWIRRDDNKPITSDRLFAGSNVLLIQHKGEQYQLRLTRNGKLILTK